MNAKQWRKAGYRTIFRLPDIYLYRPGPELVLRASVDNGNWMGYDDLAREPWHYVTNGIDGLAVGLAAHIRACVEHCYCDKGVDICDFCAGIRPAPGGRGE